MKNPKIGKLDDSDKKFILSVECEDINVRAISLGYQVTYNAKAAVVHHQISRVKKPRKLTWFHFKSLIYFIVKHNIFTKSVIKMTINKTHDGVNIQPIMS